MTTTFGTITNIQFVASRSPLGESGMAVKCPTAAGRSPSGGRVNGRDYFRCHDCIGDPTSPSDCPLANPYPGDGCVPRPSSLHQTSPGCISRGVADGSPGLAVEESPTGALRFATDRPHLVSMGGGRLSTSVTLHPINEGKTTLGAGGMGVVPDIAVLGTGIEPEHCLLEHQDGVVHLTPLAPLVSIDGIRVTARIRLTQGCMICLGRSHFFRFNHPAEAKLMRSVLPNARISMAPIGFYPAIDNPEYFHMSAQEAGAEATPRVIEGAPPNGGLSGEGSSQPRVGSSPKNTPSTLLRLPLADTSHTTRHSEKVFDFDPVISPAQELAAPIASEEGSNESSDSDSPPEVPPRSEDSCPPYVNSITTSGGGTSYPNSFGSPQSLAGTSYLGEYIYTKAEVEQATSPPRDRIPAGIVGPGLQGNKVVSHNASTSVHNATYRSLPPPSAFSPPMPLSSSSPPQSPKSLQLTPVSICAVSTSHGGIATGAISCSPKQPFEHYSTPKSLSVGDSCTPLYRGTHAKGAEAPWGTGVSSLLRTSMEDLKATELKKQQATEERIREQQTAAAEKARLEEILSMCAEYDRQQSGGSSTVSSPTATSPSSGVPPTQTRSQTSPYHSLAQNRIKTNGSLPREKRSPLGSPPPTHIGVVSPQGSVSSLSPLSPSNARATTPSEDELGSIFSFEGDLVRSGGALSRNNNLSLYPPFPNLPANVGETPSPPPVSPRSPYENVSTYLGYPVPHSPRTRIRTTVSRERRDFAEIFENKMVVSELSPRPPSPKPDPSSTGLARQKSHVETPPKPPRSPRIDRRVLGDPPSSLELRNAEASVINNKHFLEVTPKSKGLTPLEKMDSSARPHLNGDSARDLSLGTSHHSDTRLEMHSHTVPQTKVEAIKARNKVLEEQMLKNIQDTHNIADVACEIERLKEEKNTALRESVSLKTKVTELERQENEALRELEMERALIEGEMDSAKAFLMTEEKELHDLLQRNTEMQERHREERRKDTEAIDSCRTRLEEAENEFELMQKGDNSPPFPSAEEVLETLKARRDALESQRKIFEDTEFSQMESEALRESETEELSKEISEAQERLRHTKERVDELEKQMLDMTSSVRSEADALEAQRQDLLTRLNKEMIRVSTIQRQLAEFARLGVMTAQNGRISPTSSSDTEESVGSELTDRLAKLHLLDRSQEDLDRISQVTTSSPLDVSEGTLGRKTSATLMEIEKNRQWTLVKQGSIVINQERRRVEELKKRVAHEVKTQWEEERKAKEQREVACASLNSVGSEDSSLTSSDLHTTESVSSDDVIGQRSSGESAARVSLKMRQKDNEISPPCSGEQSRPLSDASSFCDTEGNPVRFREKGKPQQQRPLTRYLPVRSEEHFDLRQHIESAGHQIELCPYLTLNQSSCRGYLHKLGSKFRTWQKRWFVFDRSQRALVYFSDKSESKAKGGTYFQAIEEVYVDHLHGMKSPSPKLTFCVKTRDRIFQLMAPSPESMRIWIDVIFTGAEGYREFQGGGT